MGALQQVLVSIAPAAGGGGSAPVYVQSTMHLRQTTASTDVTLNSVGSGNCIVVFVMVDTLPGALAVTVADGTNTYVDSGIGETTQGGDLFMQTFVAKNVTAGSYTVTVTLDSTQANRVIAHEYSGASTTAPVDAFSGNFGASGAPDSGSDTTTVANTLIAGAGLSGGGTGAGAGFTLRENADDEISEDKTVASAGSYSAVFTSAGGGWIAHMVALKP